MPILSVNDDVQIPGTVVCFYVATRADPAPDDERSCLHSFRVGYSIAGRMEDGKWTRQKKSEIRNANELWHWLNVCRRSGVPTYLFSPRIALHLTVCGFWRLMESEEFRLTRERKSPVYQRLSGRRSGGSAKPQTGLLVEANPPVVVDVFHRDGWRLVALDVRNYLDKAGDDLAGLVSLEWGRDPDYDAPDYNWIALCKQRCEVTAEIVRRLLVWHNKQEFGKFGFTLAGCSLAAFRHRFMDTEIETPNEQDDRDFERLAHYGGRTEAYWCGTIRNANYRSSPSVEYTRELYPEIPHGPYFAVDSRSFYGGIQWAEVFPTRCTGHGNATFSKSLPVDIGDGSYLAECKICSDTEEFPVRIGDRVVYPTGEYVTTLCGPELSRAVATHSVRSVGNWRRYDLAPIFHTYSAAIWRERTESEKNGDGLTAALCKGMLAKLHGKFAQRRTRWAIRPDITAPGPWECWRYFDAATGRSNTYRSIAWDVQEEQDAGDSKHCFPAISAWVAAWGREYLRHWIKIAGRRNVLYVSTDSLIVTQQGKDNLEKVGIIYPSGLASCRVVAESADIEIRGANNLSFAGRVVVAGVPLDRRDLVFGSISAEHWQSLQDILARKGEDKVRSTTIDYKERWDTSIYHVDQYGWIKTPELRNGQIQWMNLD